MENVIIVAVILVIVGLAASYVIKAKKDGRKCIGCPSGCNCHKTDAETKCCCGKDKDDV